MIRHAHLAVLALFIVTFPACGGGSPSTGAGVAGGGNGGATPPAAIQHVVLVVLENQNYLDVIGNSAMSYLNDLASGNALATQFYANVHPSIGNYFMMTTGQEVNTNDAFSGTFSGESVADALHGSGKTWKIYAESLPAAGYTEGDQYPYIKHHNPFAYFDDIRNDPAQRNNIVPFSEFADDSARGNLPNYSFVVPNNLHNGHDCPAGGSSCPLSDRLTAIDGWLRTNISPLVADSSFTSGGVLIVTFDESATDDTMGGGRILVVVAGGRIKTGFQSSTVYQFPSLLRFSLKSLGVQNYPGDSASAPDMDEFLK